MAKIYPTETVYPEEQSTLPSGIGKLLSIFKSGEAPAKPQGVSYPSEALPTEDSGIAKIVSGAKEWADPAQNQEFYRNYGVPIMALVESLASKGKSPGTATMAGANLAENQRTTDEALRKSALERRKSDADIEAQEGFNADVGALSVKARAEAMDPKDKEAALADLYEKWYPVEAAKDARNMMMWTGKFQTSTQTTRETEETKNARELEEKLLEEQRAEQRHVEAEQRAEQMRIEAEQRAEQMRIEAEQRKNAAKIEAENRKYAQQMKPAQKQMENLMALGDHIPAKGRIAGGIPKVLAPLGLASEYQAYKKIAEAMLGQLARAGGESGGRFSDQDMNRTRGMLYDPQDTPEERRIKRLFWEVTKSSDMTPEDFVAQLNDSSAELLAAKPKEEAAETSETTPGLTPEEQLELEALEKKYAE